MSEKSLKQFSYGEIEYYSLFIVLLLGLTIPIMALVAFQKTSTILHIFQQGGLPTVDDLFGLLWAAFWVLALILGVPVGSNQYNRIRVVEGGLQVRIFVFWYFWKFIPWEEITGVDISPRLDRNQASVFVIKVKRLTVWHSGNSQLYWVGSQPGILVTSEMYNRFELLAIIDQHLQQLSPTASFEEDSQSQSAP